MKKLLFKLFYKNFVLSSLILVTILIIGCDITGNTVYEQGSKPEVYFCPRENCAKILENNILAADNSVYCAFYDLELKSVASALTRKSNGIEVKLIMDDENKNSLIKGQNVRFDDEKQLMHNKFCIIDNKIVITGSFNPTNNDNYNNNNNMVVFYSAALPKNYEDEFRELWDGNFGSGDKTKNPVVYINGNKIENYFCPEDGCADKVINQIKDAKSSVYFMTFAFTSGEIADALLAKDGIDIRGIFDSGQSSNKYSQYKRLKEFGINVKKDANKHKLHHKVFIIDNQTVITGSFNPTQSGDEKNDENILIIHDREIASYYLNEFDSLWH